MSRLKTVFQAPYVNQSLIVAVVVGTLLNLINQPEIFFGGGTIVWWKVALTYVVPFFVSTYGVFGALPKDESE